MPKYTPDVEHDVSSEADILSFIVRVWREEPVAKNRRAIWRGHVTPVPEGERHYFSNLKDVPTLIAAYLKAQR
ncbi:MAG TPA: hypothetical protein VK206_21905 [Anaerolineales bacterium]|nr:hypothetical protein [Anaerolineales bacterium]HLO33161.1 hypothetical protein [Anaerolineales bacterium]